MKKLLALLMMLMLGPVMAQEINPYANAIPTGNLVPDFSFDGPTGQTPQGWVLDGSNQSGGAIQPGCGALSNQGKCFIFSYMGATLSTTLDLSSYETNSFEYSFSFYYRMNCNNNIGGFCENPMGVRDTFGASFVLNDTNGQVAGINVVPMGEDYFKAGDPGVNQFDYRQVNFMGSISSEYLFTSAQLIFYGRDNGFWAGYYGPAIDRVEFSINYLPPPEEPPLAPDCTINPYDPTCIINDLTDFTDTTTLLADTTTTDTTTGSDDGSSDGTEVIEEEEEETTTDETVVADNTTEETDIEEMLSDDSEESDTEEETVVTAERDIAYRELTDEEKAALLADAISKGVIESALSIANDAAQSKDNNTSTTTVETTVTRSSNNVSSEMTVAENKTEEKQIEEKQTDASNNEALDILETGRSLGQQALANTLEQTKESAEESLTQAENIATSSSESNNSSSVAFVNNTDDNESVIANISVTNDDDNETDIANTETVSSETELPVFDNNASETQTEVSDTNTFADIMNIEIKPVTEAVNEDVEFVNQILAETNKQQEQNNSGFSEDEQVTIQNDPALANAFNVAPNTTNLELLGVIGKQEDKSDAEKRAEEIVAANKEQQDEINKNYMDADQSGLIGAIAGDTDVTAYRTANLPDLSSWYKPEDIYKNVKYNDNVRGMYFLEKGNTDTYKKMVEEQYK